MMGGLEHGFEGIFFVSIKQHINTLLQQNLQRG
jgi:hypothetical protein